MKQTQTDNLFQGIVLIELQGQRALNLLQIEETFVVYQIEGFKSLPLYIHDYRNKPRHALDFVISGMGVADFLNAFCSPVDLIVQQTENAVIFELRETIHIPTYILWISIGFAEDLPIYDDVVRYIEPYTTDSVALTELYTVSSEELAEMTPGELVW